MSTRQGPRVHPRATIRSLRCAVCGGVVPAQVATTPHPEAAEMFQLPATAWIGLTPGASGYGTKEIVACSDACAQRLGAEAE